MRILHSLRRAAVAVALLTAPAYAEAAEPTRLLARPEQHADTVTGMVRGYEDARYTVAVPAGARMEVTLWSGNTLLYFNVLSAVFVGSMQAEPGRFSVCLPCFQLFTMEQETHD